jgi:hypothetical protein
MSAVVVVKSDKTVWVGHLLPWRIRCASYYHSS